MRALNDGPKTKGLSVSNFNSALNPLPEKTSPCTRLSVSNFNSALAFYLVLHRPSSAQFATQLALDVTLPSSFFPSGRANETLIFEMHAPP